MRDVSQDTLFPKLKELEVLFYLYFNLRRPLPTTKAIIT